MARAITTKTLLEKTYRIFEFFGVWAKILGQPERGGCWIIYGNEKNGKTAFALALANFLSAFSIVLYVSAEEGTGKDFQENARRAKLDPKNKRIRFLEYEDLRTIRQKLDSRKGPEIVLIDNVTVYVEELKNGALRKLLNDYPKVTFIFLAHQEQNEPYTATGKLIKKLAKIIIRIEGLTAFVSGRCPGGEILINKESAALYHGSEVLTN